MLMADWANIPASNQRRLLFSEKCGVFYVLRHVRIPHDVVAKAFGIHRSTVSHIGRATPQSPKYGQIAHQYDRLGAVAFGEKYFTEEMRAALADARENHAFKPKPGPTRAHARLLGLRILPAGGQSSESLIGVRRRKNEETYCWQTIDWGASSGPQSLYPTPAPANGRFETPYGALMDAYRAYDLEKPHTFPAKLNNDEAWAWCERRRARSHQESLDMQAILDSPLDSP
jgi:hypothetical protein